ncbi:MAG: hypothetical protein J6Y78_01795 [Paludibacteraceae bacterium]|nr:hypothetical protein [Paludibacteraceae bacterium]
MVTEYINNKCKYNYSKLKKVVYLISEEHTKGIHLDGAYAYIDNISQLPLRLNGFDISLNEEASLDERYEFQKSVTLSMNGYVNHRLFEGRYYVILESEDGTFWMVNIDFPSRVTYTFNLSKDTYQTDFTFSSLSNYPTLRLIANFEAVAPPCIGFNVYGIESLKMIEKDKTVLDTNNRTVYTYDDYFKDVEFLGNSCSYSSVYDGFKVQDTITFSIGFDAYKSAWHYNLIEFVNNLYSAIIVPKSSTNTLYVGFNFGLEPSFTVSTSDQNDESDIVTITLRETSVEGLTAANDWTEEQSTETRWLYIKNYGNIVCWECVRKGKGRYLVQREVYANGTPTGRFKAKAGYESQYEDVLNIVDTFDDDELFDEPTCGGDACEISTNMPLSMTFTDVTCNTYSISSECDWHIDNVPVGITVTPTSGVAESAYTITVCNTVTPSGTTNGTFDIISGDNDKVVNVEVTDETGILRPSTININCLEQTVSFVYNSNCPITVTSIDSALTYSITNARLIVNVPRNYYTGSTKTYSITVRDCNNNTQTVTINQDRTYEQWVATSNYICLIGNSYVAMQRYTGTTPTNITTMTGERRAGERIMSGDPRCASAVYKRWVTSSEYICINGDKWSQEEEETSTDGVNWTKTGNVRPLAMVESASTYCEQTITYSWVLTQQWQCEENPAPVPPVTYQWVTTTGYTCSGTTKMSREKEQVSYDSGSTWTDTGQYRAGSTVLAYNSEDCGYVPPPPTDYSTQYLTFESEGDNVSIYFGVNGNYTSSAKTISASTDNGVTWTAYTATSEWTQIATLDTGEKVLVKGENDTYYHNRFDSDDGTQHYKVYGNIMSLISGDSFTSATTLSTNYTFTQLFGASGGLTNVENLVLPATTLANFCYYAMFANCTSLLAAPSLPSTTLAGGCYYSMFSGCTSLTSAPALPATTLTGSCYYAMFSGCISLTTAPVLPATTLTSLCYQNMFRDCSSLNYVKCLATNISATNCTFAWLHGVAANGTFVKNSSMTGWTTGEDGIPSGWTIENAS